MQQLLLLHGAIGSSSQLQPLASQLSTAYKVYTLDFRGHGGNPVSDEAFSIAAFADDVLSFMNKEQMDKVSIFGYSMGGYVAMYLAKHHPNKINRIITLATKYHWDEAIATKEAQMVNPEKMEQKVPAFAQTLKERHAPEDWKLVLNKTAAMMAALGKDNTLKTEDYATITNRVLLMLGDRDKMVTLAETVNVYASLPNAEMAVLPGTPHPIEQAETSVLSFMINKFLGQNI